MTLSSWRKLNEDRFHYMWQFLEVPFQDIAIKEKPRI